MENPNPDLTQALLEQSSVVKVMEKVTHVWVVDNYSTRKNIGVGQSIQSDPITVGDYSFTVHWYPQGKDEAAHNRRRMSLCIKNQSAQVAEVVTAFAFLPRYPIPGLDTSRSSFDDRGIYRQYVALEPGAEWGNSGFWEDCLRWYTYVRNDCIKIRTTIGVFIHRPLAMVHQPFDRTVFIRVAHKRFYAEESVLRRRCPSLLLLSDSDTEEIWIAGVDTDIFDAVLWYIYNEKLESRDKRAISEDSVKLRFCRTYHDSFALKMLAAADRFDLKFLRRTCESIMFYVDTSCHDVFFGIECAIEKIWSIVCRGFTSVKCALEKIWSNVCKGFADIKTSRLEFLEGEVSNGILLSRLQILMAERSSMAILAVLTWVMENWRMVVEFLDGGTVEIDS